MSALTETETKTETETETEIEIKTETETEIETEIETETETEIEVEQVSSFVFLFRKGDNFVLAKLTTHISLTPPSCPGSPTGYMIVEGYQVIDSSHSFSKRLFENSDDLCEEAFRTHVHTPVQVPRVIPGTSSSAESSA